MTIRPAEGFVTSNGTFFETEEEAERYETTTNLLEAIKTDPYIRKNISFDETTFQYFTDRVLDFIHLHSDTIQAYITARDVTFHEEKTTTDQNDLQDGALRSLVERAEEQFPDRPKPEPSTDDEDIPF